MQPIPPQPGSAQDLRHFVGRKQTTALARQKLRNGTNLLLNDPRRMGKTYWIKHFAATTTDFTAVVVDYEGVRSREEFLLRTVDALRDSTLGAGMLDALRGFFDNFEPSIDAGPLKVKVALQKQSPAKTLADTLGVVADKSQQTVLICMDEVPLALRSIARAEGTECAIELLQTLRGLRQAESRIRWILAGSVGFHHVLAECGTTEGDINDLDNLPFGPLTDPDDRELAGRLLAGIDREPGEGATLRLVDRTGGIPYLLHKIASMLQERGPGQVNATDVDEAFEDFIDDPDDFRSFSHLLTRLEPNYGNDAGLARTILDLAAARTDSWVNVTQIESDLGSPEPFDAVLDSLVSDHYLVRRGLRIKWRYPVLQYIWARRTGLRDRP